MSEVDLVTMLGSSYSSSDEVMSKTDKETIYDDGHLEREKKGIC